MKEKFPDDYNYIPKTYISENMDLFKEKFKNYNMTEDNLWLIKPNYLLQGKNIRFLKNINDVKNNEIVTKYISNPLLIEGKKFDLRIYTLVTGYNQMKIYLYNEYFARLATENYDLNLNNTNNIFKLLTNIHVGIKNKKRKNDIVMSMEETEKYIEEIYHINFSKIWEDIKDIIIKSFIYINENEIEEEL